MKLVSVDPSTMKNRDLSDGRWVGAAVWPTIVAKEVLLSKEAFLRQQAWEAFRPDRQRSAPKPSTPAKKRKLPLPDEPGATQSKVAANHQGAGLTDAATPTQEKRQSLCIDSAMHQWGVRQTDGGRYPPCRFLGDCKFSHGVGKQRPTADEVRAAIRGRAAKRPEGAAAGRALLSAFEEAVAGKTA